MNQKLEIKVIEAKDGTLVSKLRSDDYKVNDAAVKIAGTVNYDTWYWCAGVPTKIQPPDVQKRFNHRYELIDKSLSVDDRIPVKVEAVEHPSYSWIIHPDYARLESLYKLTYDIALEIQPPTEFTIIKHDKVNARIGDFSKLNIHGQVPKSYTLDELLNPAPVLQFRPKYLTSKQVFDIIRASVKANLDPRYAKISSDYDFHFKVDKRVELTVEEAYTVDVSGFKSKKPKYETRYRDSRNVTILDIATEPKWGPVCPDIKADNFAELDTKVRLLVADIVKTINTPVKDCSCCKGVGVIFEKVELNEQTKKT